MFRRYHRTDKGTLTFKHQQHGRESGMNPASTFFCSLFRKCWPQRKRKGERRTCRDWKPGPFPTEIELASQYSFVCSPVAASITATHPASYYPSNPRRQSYARPTIHRCCCFFPFVRSIFPTSSPSLGTAMARCHKAAFPRFLQEEVE